MLAERSVRRRKVGLTPLIDVVFQLLIFFMLASSFSQLRAISLAAEEAETGDSGEHAVVARVFPGGRVEIRGIRLEAADLRAHLGRLIAGRDDAGVLVVAEAGASLQEAVVVFDAAHAAGAAEVSLGRR